MSPVMMLLHPVGIGSTRAMNVASAKMWLRALIDAIPAVAFEASWLAYAEIAISRERGIDDALRMLDRCDGVVAVGGEFSRGMLAEWKRAAERKLRLVDLTQPPMPKILTMEDFGKTRTPAFQAAIAAALGSARAA